MVVRAEVLQRFLHHTLHADLVDVTHVVHVEADVMHESLLAGVDRADADLADTVGCERRRVPADLGQFVWPEAAQARDRHAMDVARGCDRTGVEVGVRVQPEHGQAFADREAVIATEQDRQALVCKLGADRLHDGAVPGQHRRQVPIAFDRRLPRIGRAAEVAAVDDIETTRSQRLGETGDAQRLRAH